jgi:hypothetical protein
VLHVASVFNSRRGKQAHAEAVPWAQAVSACTWEAKAGVGDPHLLARARARSTEAKRRSNMRGARAWVVPTYMHGHGRAPLKQNEAHNNMRGHGHGWSPPTCTGMGVQHGSEEKHATAGGTGVQLHAYAQGRASAQPYTGQAHHAVRLSSMRTGTDVSVFL